MELPGYPFALMQIVTSQDSFDTSVRKALAEIDPDYMRYPGLIITGSHAPSNVDAQLLLLKTTRTTGIPTLGICFGMQLMAIEFVDSVFGIPSTSEEFTDAPRDRFRLIQKLSEIRVGMRKVGKRMESHWHNYALFDGYIAGQLRDHFDIVSTDSIVEIMELRDHPFYLGTQFHPEYQSSKTDPHPVLLDFLTACRTAA
jgi:CTP synthase